jgi:hypothetical protein
MSAEVTFTRDEAIAHVVGGLTRGTVDAGAELATILGAETAARLTVHALEVDQAAMDALGVTEDDVRRVAQSLKPR